MEMSFKMDTDLFLNAFLRMASRRGIPELIFSDNAGKFVRTNKELKDLLNQLNQEKSSRQKQTKEFNGHSILQ